MSWLRRLRAEGCGAWTAAFGPLAGEGEEFHVSYCSEERGFEHSFEITCSTNSLNVRFMPQFESDGLSFDKVKLNYAVDGQSFVVDSQYEELDGAFASDVAVSDPLIKAMKAGKTAVVTLQDVKAPTYQVPLKGFSKAMNKLVGKCS